MKYTVSGSTLQYKVGLTLSFLSLISRGVGTIQKGNTSIIIQPPTSNRDELMSYSLVTSSKESFDLAVAASPGHGFFPVDSSYSSRFLAFNPQKRKKG
jgi:hypothetical protein